jgi:hypothetical protein
VLSKQSQYHSFASSNMKGSSRSEGNRGRRVCEIPEYLTQALRRVSIKRKDADQPTIVPREDDMRYSQTEVSWYRSGASSDSEPGGGDSE